MTKLFGFLLLALLACSWAAKPTLRMRADGTFRIVQFTDLHFGEGDQAKDNATLKVMTDILQLEVPDLVVITGDCVSGWYGQGKPGWIESFWPTIVSPMVKANIPWAFMEGNHDSEANLNRAQVAYLDSLYPLSLTSPSIGIHGATNYLLSVLPASTGVNAAPALNIWAFDSGDYNCLGVKGYDCIHPDQIEWYREQSYKMKLTHLKTIPALAFFHIPLWEHMAVVNHFNVSGVCSEQPCCGSMNTGLFAAFKELDDVKMVSVGHDHDDDYIGTYHGIDLMYGRKTGYGCYGPTALKGARVFEVKANPFSIKYWIRQEDGSVVERQDQHAPDPKLQYNVCGDSVGATQRSKKWHVPMSWVH